MRSVGGQILNEVCVEKCGGDGVGGEICCCVQCREEGSEWLGFSSSIYRGGVSQRLCVVCVLSCTCVSRSCVLS